jgi:acyl carrier protein
MNSSLPPLDQSLVRREQLPLSAAYIAPRTPTEQRLAEIWRTVLSMDSVGVEDDYFDLGGDSLLAVAIFGRIGNTFLITIPMATLVEAPTIAKLAAWIDGHSPNGKK